MENYYQQVLSSLPLCYASGDFIELSHSGDTNHNFALVCGLERYFVRVGNQHSEKFGINRYDERDIIDEAYAQKLAPRALYADPKHGVLIFNWHDDFINPRFLSGEEKAHLMANICQSVHHLEITSANIKHLDIKDRLALFFEQVESPPRWLCKLQHFFERNYARFQYTPVCVCHHDLHFENIQQHPIRVTDWEYASIGDPIFELSMVIRINRFNEDMSRLFLKYYGNHVLEKQNKKILKMLPMVDYTCLLWAMVRYKNDSEDPHMKKLAVLRKSIESEWL